MTVTPITTSISLRGPSPDPRTPGLHLSSILQALATSLGILDDEQIPLSDLIRDTPYHEVGKTSRLMLVSMGLAWEEWLAPRLRGVTFHPGEFELDGVIGTPDGIEPRIKRAPRIHETKATFKSAKRTIDQIPMWLWQAAGYCKMVGAYYGVLVNTVVFHPLYLRGRYDSEFPLYLPFEVQFEREELDSYWGMILRHKHMGVPEGEQEN